MLDRTSFVRNIEPLSWRIMCQTARHRLVKTLTIDFRWWSEGEAVLGGWPIRIIE